MTQNSDVLGNDKNKRGTQQNKLQKLIIYLWH